LPYKVPVLELDSGHFRKKSSKAVSKSCHIGFSFLKGHSPEKIENNLFSVHELSPKYGLSIIVSELHQFCKAPGKKLMLLAPAPGEKLMRLLAPTPIQYNKSQSF
jgi:hypothetical protein